MTSAEKQCLEWPAAQIVFNSKNVEINGVKLLLLSTLEDCMN